MAVNLIFERQPNKHKLNVRLIVLIVCEISLTYFYLYVCMWVCSLRETQAHSSNIFIGCKKVGISAHKYLILSLKKKLKLYIMIYSHVKKFSMMRV